MNAHLFNGFILGIKIAESLGDKPIPLTGILRRLGEVARGELSISDTPEEEAKWFVEFAKELGKSGDDLETIRRTVTANNFRNRSIIDAGCKENAGAIVEFLTKLLTTPPAS